MLKLELVTNAVEYGKIKVVEGLVKELLKEGIKPDIILNDSLKIAMNIVSAKYQAGEIFVPEVLLAAKTMKKGFDTLKPYLVAECNENREKFIIGTVAGDLHDIGKNLVALMLESVGFEVLDLGVNVPAWKFMKAILDNPDCKIVGMSSLLTTTLGALKDTISAITVAGYTSQIKIMVGGAAVTQVYANIIGADVYTQNAGEAAIKAKELITLMSSDG